MTIVELNQAVADGSINEIVRVAEARQCKELGRIADVISARSELRLILLAGASAAGKTTTAKRLCTQLRVNGADVRLLSTDDYFVGDKRNPRDENGKLDYEHVECVDIPMFTSDLNALLRGERIRTRRFDFQKHEGAYTDEWQTLAPGGYLVVEGIHALNPRLTEGVDDACKFRVFIEPKTQLTFFGNTQIPVEAGRFVRRIVRDNSFRKLSPLVTYKLWPKVRAGEVKWIEPFRPNADVEFDSGLCYELGVLRPYALGPLVRMLPKVGYAPEFALLLEVLQHVQIVSPALVPGDSILRETIGGSLLEY